MPEKQKNNINQEGAEPAINEELQNKIQEIQMLEQNHQNLLMQKQAFQLELNETQNALTEVSNSNEDIFKLVGQIMIKTNKQETEKELKQKQELLSLRLKSIDKQETELSNQVEDLRKEIMKQIK